MKKNTYTVPAGTMPERLDTYITPLSNLTRSYIQRLIKEGAITVNSHCERARYTIREGDVIEVALHNEPDGTLAPEDIPLDILYEDQWMVVVNKPPDMVIYPAAGNKSGTLMNALVSRCDKLASVGAPLRPGVIHRLDKDTSGVIVIAKDDAAYHKLIAQFKERKVEKYYLALVFGSLKEQRGEIRTLIGRSRWNRKKMSVKTDRGKEAITKYEVIKRLRCASLVKVRIITGRTHQIRVHFAFRGHPVLGDRTYGKKTELPADGTVIGFPRQMLHACSIKLEHPAGGMPMEFTAPMPEDMEKAVKELTHACPVR
ncbi:MAG: RluA family pseudouridine synthase [Nitrospirae bacterium]|nr:RluA family pseudouridine synthase [Nitrospirota bacterium]